MPVDVLDELELVEQQIEKEKREAAEVERRKHLKIRAKYSTAKINPFNVYGIEPWRERVWHRGRQPTDKQIAFLERSGVDVSGLSFTHAQQLIKQIIEKRKKGKCSYKQAKTLQRFGYDTEVSFEQVKDIISELAANGWKRTA
jgi:stalled ribosome alternative rescue factor ArfA